MREHNRDKERLSHILDAISVIEKQVWLLSVMHLFLTILL